MKKKQFSLVTATDRPKLHAEISELLFENRHLIKTAFRDIQGFYDLSYMGLAIINPDNQIVCFSTIPSIEFNLINQSLWIDDPCFSSKSISSSALTFWEGYNERLKKIKLANNGFSLGFTVSRQLANFYLLYSYATTSKHSGLKEYYSSNLSNLIKLGDYLAKAVSPAYSSPDFLQALATINSKETFRTSKPYLKLIKA